MRLIDAEAIESRLRELGWFESNKYYCGIVLKCILDYSPTAYDVDKVVEQLEDMEVLCNECGNIAGLDMAKKAIKIVKEGGVNE